MRQSDYMYVIHSYSNEDFWRNFRVSRITFGQILNFLKKNLEEKTFTGGFHPLPMEAMLFVTLYYLANQGAMRLISEKFGFCESTVWKCVREVTRCFSRKQDLFIKWPGSNNNNNNNNKLSLFHAVTDARAEQQK